MSDKSRRNFLSVSAKMLAGTAALASMGVAAGSHEHHNHGSGDGMMLDASKKDTCGTCGYWGGMRKASKDKTMVMAQSMGWCNNPDSMNYQKLTSADHLMKKTGMWKKWSVL